MLPVDHLIAAVLEGDRARVDELVHNDPSLGAARNMFGVSPLHAAHFTGSHDLVDLLRPSNDDDIYVAAELGDVDVVQSQLAARAFLATQFNSRGSTALHGACYWGQIDTARKLLDAGAEVRAATRDGFLQISPLGSAIATTPGVPQPSDDEDVVLALVRLLLERGADPNHARLDGMTALHSAAWRGLDRVAQELLDAGADASKTATSGPHAGESAADTALSQGHLVLAARLDRGTDEITSPYR